MWKTITAVAALVIASALVLPTVSLAEEFNSADQINSVAVSYADLNLTSKPGQFSLQRRMKNAARDVCVYEDSRDIQFASQVNGCRNSAISRAQPAYEAAVAAARRGSVTVIDAAALVVTAY
jgi:UrcA family protein